MMVLEFRLSPPGSRHGISCDESGAFVGAIPFLERSFVCGKDRWRPRDCDELSKQLRSHFALPIDISSKAGKLKAIANALNEGDLARAQIATVLLGIPDPPPLTKDAHYRREMLEFIRALHRSGLIKADWNPDEHPRWPAGVPDSQGGRFAPKTEADECGLNETARRRWMRAEGKDWPIDPETGRKQDVAHIRARADGGSDEPDNIRPMRHSEHVREHMERGDFSRWARRAWANRSQKAESEGKRKTNSESRSKVSTRPARSAASKPGLKATPKPAPETVPNPEDPVPLEEVSPEELPIIIPE